MARIRSIKPEFNGSASVNRMSESAQLFMVKLLTECDDYGRIRWLPKKIAGNLYPRRDDIDAARINELAAELVAEEIFLRYEIDGEQYGCFPRWTDHQRIDRPSRSDIPPPSELPESCKPRVTVASDAGDSQESLDHGKGTREKEKERDNDEPPKRFIKPTITEVSDYCKERKNSVSPLKFISFYESKGWMVGKNLMKDWKAALRGWETDNRQGRGPPDNEASIIAARRQATADTAKLIHGDKP
jgi:hypothetical protein